MFQTMSAKSEDPPVYAVTPLPTQEQAEEEVIAKALSILRTRLKTRDAITAPTDVTRLLQLHAAAREDQHREVFSVLWLDAQHHIITIEDLFHGTLTQTSVYPREIVRAALRHNAAAVVLTHNHPSGGTAPSRADEALTAAIKAALALVDVRVLDHIITGGSDALSMAEHGLL